MHSGNSEKAASLRKRTLSRGMSEDESLRHIIREAEETNRYLSRNDSRCGSLKRGQRKESLVEQRADYELCLQEMRALELQQEARLFQVDCLQDALEGAEEMLSEAQREARAVTMELERERDARRKLEDMVASLMQEMEVLKEERNSVSVFPVNDLVGDQTQGVVDISAVFSGTSVDGDISSEGMSTVAYCPAATETSSKAALGFKSGHTELFQARHAGPIWLQDAPDGTSVDQEASLISDTESSPLNLNRSSTLQLEKVIDPTVHFNQKCEAHDRDDNDESSGYEDAPSEFSPTPSTPDGVLLEGDNYMGGNESDSSRNADSCALS
ncbi:uncharacterized protein si:ch1073-456m8.1 isoform X2 [Triplophysa rosa]|uniref:uncharacterized protein si:ch1073-456m8.1 isoform X2 n=1 Tax=Triplophysa rosa TaxID=992332 RepID=UPI002546081B|nr:uncharacterized protein si:ch1073-456m8.1 isoform X2 [Triplophysa rosa]